MIAAQNTLTLNLSHNVSQCEDSDNDSIPISPRK